MNFKHFKTYSSIALTYGFSRKILHTHDASIKCYNKDYNSFKIPMLFTQRLSVIGFGGLISAVYMPIYILKDTIELETWIRNVDPVLYGIDEPELLYDFIMK